MRDLRAHLAVAVGLTQKVANLLQLLHRLVYASDVGELDLGARLGRGLGFGLAKAHGAAVLPLHLVHEVDQDGNHEQGGHEGDEDRLPQVVAGRVHGEAHVAVLLHQLVQAVRSHIGGLEGRDRVGAVGVVLALHGPVGGVVRDLRHALVLDGRHELAGGQGVRGVLGEPAATERVHQVAHQRRKEQRVYDAGPLGGRRQLRAGVAAAVTLVEVIPVWHVVSPPVKVDPSVLLKGVTKAARLTARLLICPSC